jgi:ribosomal protein S18 acetylase RimI-like enzyme
MSTIHEITAEHFAGFIQLFYTNECLLTLGKTHNNPVWHINGQLYVDNVLRTELQSFTTCKKTYATPAGSKLWVLTDGPLVLGAVGVKISLDGKAAELCRMYVQAHCQGQGHGRRLVLHLLQHVKNLKNCNRVHLTTPSVNQPAIGFYLKMGFVMTQTLEVTGPDNTPLELTELELHINYTAVSSFLSSKLVFPYHIDKATSIPMRENLLIDIWRIVFQFMEFTQEDKQQLSLQCRLFRDAFDNLTDMFKTLSLHPVHLPNKLLQFARRRKENNKERWTRAVARSFGTALQESKRCHALENSFVEAIHPRWKRWRCAMIQLTPDTIAAYSGGGGGNSDSLDGTSTASRTPAQLAPIYNQLAEERKHQSSSPATPTPDDPTTPTPNTLATTTIPATTATTTTTTNTTTTTTTTTTTMQAPSHQNLILLFYDQEHHANVPSTNMRSISFSAIALLDAAQKTNYLRLLQLMRSSANLNTTEALRIGCSLIISMTVGNTAAREELCSIGCAQIVLENMKKQLSITCASWRCTDQAMDQTADMMEQLTRVCMNLVCSDAGIDDFVRHGGISLLLKAILETHRALRLHDGFVYATIKTLHNVAIEHDQHRRTMILEGVLDVIEQATVDHSTVLHVVRWFDRAKNAIKRFDGPELSFRSVVLEQAKIELEITDKQMVESKIALANAILLHKREDKKVKVLEERIRKAKAAAKREAQEEEAKGGETKGEETKGEETKGETKGEETKGGETKGGETKGVGKGDTEEQDEEEYSDGAMPFEIEAVMSPGGSIQIIDDDNVNMETLHLATESSGRAERLAHHFFNN